ncbi:FlgM family anti-sigma-28 factor [Salsuginibacillus halophilus]|uniref:Negative regulator of flagellin synthesis n=1 Tax=Salsuginibacillus halophilus TaxID=517424 RepID=A0A2P8HQT1_9BACI|nr:flagellar biosynthesis anti-sigma factor FlgM [Salsuginibacillus halophilus]PSL48569.1 FlgM family anti-sigma-28 factor [Salsuginibacillus halophilus]
MKINPLGPMNNNPYRQQVEKQNEAGQAAQKKDQVEISDQAKHMQQESGDEIRTDKVNELKQQIDSGEYNVNNNDIARSLYDFWNGS